MIRLALVVAAVTLALGVGGALSLRLLPSVRLRLIGLVLLCVAMPLVAVVLSGVAMFDMGSNVVLLGLAAASGLVAVVGAFFVVRDLSRSFDALRSSSGRLASGEFDVRAPQDGPQELAEVGTSFNEMASRLEEVFDARRELVAWASHDLRTPLTSLQAALEAIADGVVPTERYLAAMLEQVTTMRSLVDDLFALSLIEAGAFELDLRAIDPAELIESCLRRFDRVAAERNVDLDRHLGPSLPHVWVDPTKIDRVLQNLVENAIEHVDSGGTVTVAAEGNDGVVIVSVDDNGTGFPDGSDALAFDRFWSGSPARSAGRHGSGLGLAIAKGFVEGHGGRVWVEQRNGHGACVAFTMTAVQPSERRS